MSSEEKKRTYSLKEGKELIDEEVVVPIQTVEKEAREIAKNLGKGFVPDAMKKGIPLDGVIIGYDEKTRKYQVQIDEIKFTLQFFRDEIIVKKIENLKLTAALNRPNSDTDSDTDSDAEEVMKLKF